MKNNKLKNSLIIGIFAFLFTTSANAQQNSNDHKEPPTYAQLLKELDANEDGKLAKAEVKSPLKEKFNDIDTDEDGFITEDEFKYAPKPKHKKRS